MSEKLPRGLLQPFINNCGKAFEDKLILKQTNGFLVVQLAGTEGKPEIILHMAPTDPFLCVEVTVGAVKCKPELQL